MFLWEQAIISGKPNSKIDFGCLILMATGVAFFDLFYPPLSHLQEKQALHFHNFSFPHFPAILVSNNHRSQ